jgi:hypothetical protein
VLILTALMIVLCLPLYLIIKISKLHCVDTTPAHVLVLCGAGSMPAGVTVHPDVICLHHNHSSQHIM